MWYPDRHLLSVLGVAALVILAGCNGIGTGQDSSSYPSEITEETFTQHQSQLEERGGFEATESNTAEIRAAQNRTVIATVNFQVNLTSNQTYQTYTVNESGSVTTATVYRIGNRLYTRQTGPNGTTTPIVDTKPNNGVGVTPPQFDQATGGRIPIALDYTRQGTTTLDGIEVARYTTNTTDRAALRNATTPAPVRRAVQPSSSTQVDRFEGTIWLDQDGILRKAELRYTVSSSEGTDSLEGVWTFRLERVGAPSIEAPAWTSDALVYNQTGS